MLHNIFAASSMLAVSTYAVGLHTLNEVNHSAAQTNQPNWAAQTHSHLANRVDEKTMAQVKSRAEAKTESRGRNRAVNYFNAQEDVNKILQESNPEIHFDLDVNARSGDIDTEI